jgi:hypothetical protein
VIACWLILGGLGIFALGAGLTAYGGHVRRRRSGFEPLVELEHSEPKLVTRWPRGVRVLPEDEPILRDGETEGWWA